MTDAPSDEFEKILVTIDGVTLIGGGPQIDLYTGRETIDLRDLEDFSDLFLYADEVPARAFSKIRLRVAKIELVTGGPSPVVIDVTVPANGKIDLVPDQPIEVMSGKTLVIEIDMDANKSIHIHETGNGKYKFRPVVFVSVGYAVSPKKLTRVHGVITRIFDLDAYELCTTGFIAGDDSSGNSPSDGSGEWADRHRCMTLEIGSETGLFDENGDPADLDSLIVGQELTVVGRFHLVDDDHSLFHSYSGQFEYLGREDYDGSHFIHQTTDLVSPTNKGSDDEAPTRARIVLVSLVIELGPVGTFLNLKGWIDSKLSDADEFDFSPVSGQGFGEDTVVRSLFQDGTRVFTRQGVEVGDILEPGLRAKIDGVFGDATDSEGLIYKTALIVVDVEASGSEDLRGVIASLDSNRRRIVLEIQGDDSAFEDCVDVRDGASLFLIEETSQGVTSERIEFDDLSIGWLADAYGEVREDEKCLLANSVISFVPAVAPNAAD